MKSESWDFWSKVGTKKEFRLVRKKRNS
jgi:hypothetical protein